MKLENKTLEARVRLISSRLDFEQTVYVLVLLSSGIPFCNRSPCSGVSGKICVTYSKYI